MIQCKHFFIGGGKNATPKKGKSFSLRLIALVAFTATFAACSNNEDAPQQNAGTQPALHVALNNPASRALIADAYLPEGAEIGFSLTGEGGSTYDGTAYSNLAYTATGTGATQTWAPKSGVTAPSLSATKGTAYAYYPYTADATDFTAIPVSVSAESQTDWMYATPVTGVNGAKADINLTMNHAMTAVRLSLANDAASPYTGEGVISGITVTSDGLGTTGTLNATTGAVTVTDAGTGLTLSGLALSLGDSPVQDIIFLPAGTAGDIEITLTVDGNEYITTAPSVTALQGNIYNYVVKIGNTGASVAVSTVNPWSDAFAEVPELEVAPAPVPLKGTIDLTTAATGVYAVCKNGKGVSYDDADETCIAVALIVNDAPTPQRLMIEKNGEANTTSIKAAYTEDGATNTSYTYFYWGPHGTDVSGITNYTSASSASTYGYIPLIDGTYYFASVTQLGAYTTWTGSYALNDWNGKENTAALLGASDTDSNTKYANMGTYVSKFNATASENQGYTDWYIPSLGQLALIHTYTGRSSDYGGNVTGGINEMLTKIGGTTFNTSDDYWSSSEYSSNGGWNVSFYRGFVDYGNKGGNFQVRFVRDI